MGLMDQVKKKLATQGILTLRKLATKLPTPVASVAFAYRDEKAYFLAKWWDRMTIEEKHECLEMTWLNQGSSARLGYDWWIPYFKEIGFLTNCGAEKPIKEVRLYRGSRPELKCGMPWTTNPIVAKVFAERGTQTGTKRVWTTKVSPELVLGIVKGVMDSSHMDGMEGLTDVVEYIVDYRGLDPDLIEEYHNNSQVM